MCRFEPQGWDFSPEAGISASRRGGTHGWTNGQTNERTKVPLCSTGHRPLRGRCPKRPDTRQNSHGQLGRGENHSQLNEAGYTAIQSRTVGQEQLCEICSEFKNVIYLSSTPNFSYLYFASDEAYFANAEANDFEERLLRARLLRISCGDH